jgi:hypothetical protein
MKPRILDAFVAKYILKLPDVGYYRRCSAFNADWEKCKQFSEDMFITSQGLMLKGDKERSLYYGFDKECKSVRRAVPEVTKDLNFLPLIVRAIKPLWFALEMDGYNYSIELRYPRDHESEQEGFVVDAYAGVPNDRPNIMYRVCEMLWKNRRALRRLTSVFKFNLADIEGEKTIEP